MHTKRLLRRLFRVVPVCSLILSVPVHGAAVQPAEPTAFYLFDGNFRDAGGVYRAENNGASFVSGAGNVPLTYEGNQALQFVAVESDYVSVADDPVLRPGTSAWSVAFWFKAAAAAQEGMLVCKKSTAAPAYNQFFCEIGTIVDTANPGAGTQIVTYVVENWSTPDRWAGETTSDVVDGGWHHVAVVRPGSSDPLIYIDGSVAAVTEELDDGTPPRDINNTEPWVIGSEGGTDVFYDGLIDEVAMWRTALSADNVEWLATNSIRELAPPEPPTPLAYYPFDGDVHDVAGTYDGSLSGAVFVSGGGNVPVEYPGNRALSFDGDGDEVIIADDAALRPGTNAWTLSVWVKAAAADQWGRFVGKHGGLETAYNQMSLWIGGTGADPGAPGAGRKIRPYVAEDFNTACWAAYTDTNGADAAWHHFALVRPYRGEPIAYLDGAVASVTIQRENGTAPRDIDNTGVWSVGSANGASYYTGLIDDFAMWDTALTDRNIEWLAANSMNATSGGTLILVR